MSDADIILGEFFCESYEEYYKNSPVRSSEISSFIEGLNSLSNLDRIIPLFVKIIELYEECSFDQESLRATLLLINNFDNDKIIRVSPEDKYKLDKKYCYDYLNELYNEGIDCVNFSIFIDLVWCLIDSLTNTILFHNLYEKKNLIKENLPLISQNDDLLIVAPLIYNIEEWKEIVKYELDRVNNKTQFVLLKKKIEYSLYILDKRFGNNNVPNVNCSDINFVNNNLFQEIITCLSNRDYKYKDILDFEKYIKNYKYPIVDSAFIKIEKLNRSKKINLKMSPKALLSTMIDFFERNDMVIDDDKESRIKRFILNVFDFDSKYSFSSSSEGTINFLNFELRENLCYLIMLLKKCNSIDYKSMSEIYSVLIDELKESNQENIGFGKVTMKNLFSEINKTPQLLKSIPKRIGYPSYSFFTSTLINTK